MKIHKNVEPASDKPEEIEDKLKQKVSQIERKLKQRCLNNLKGTSQT